MYIYIFWVEKRGWKDFGGLKSHLIQVTECRVEQDGNASRIILEEVEAVHLARLYAV